MNELVLVLVALSFLCMALGMIVLWLFTDRQLNGFYHDLREMVEEYFLKRGE